MANRFPLVIDTTDGNKIKELPSGDNLNLRESNIVHVQDIDALGTINAAVVTVNGEKLVAQNFADLTDTPGSYAGAEDYFVKVNEAGTGLEFRPITDIGNIDLDTVTVTEDILPAITNTGSVGTDVQKFQRVTANELKGSLLTFNGQTVFNAETGKITYAAIQGAPTNLSEFTDDIGFLRTADLDDSLSGLFDQGVPFTTDIQGSVFADDSTMIVDGVEGVIRGDTVYSGTGFIRGQTIVILADDTVQLGATELTDNIRPDVDGSRSIGTEDYKFSTGYFDTLNINSSTIETINSGSGLGVPNITSSTDITITAGNRININGNVPLKFSTTNDVDRDIIVAQSGDTIYNTDENRLQIYQNGEWVSLHKGTFTGNLTTDSGTSNFNDVVVAGNLTVSGTTTTVDTENTTISDNVIVLNNGESGAGVTAGTSGIEIDRGSETNKTLVWDETDDKWTVGSETFAANTFEAVGFQGSLFGNGGLNSPLQLTSGLEGQTGNTIFINPQGSDTLVQMWGETVNLVTGPFNTYDSPYMQFKTEGAFKAYQGAYFDGNLIGDVKGSVVGDDSTILVDGVAGKIVGDIENAEVVTTTVQGRDSAALNIYRGTGGTVSLGNASSGDVSVGDSGINITATAGVNVNGAAGGTVDIGTGSTTGNVTIGKSGNTTTIDGTFNATLTGDVAGNLTGNVAGNVTGNIDNTTLNIGTTDATAINIGNDSSAIVMDGTLQLNSALIVNNLIADDSISITTADGDGNGISLGPQGTNTAVNLTADSIRFFGPVTTEIQATGGITGDLKGSVFGDDSTVLVDAVNNSIPYAVLNGAPTALSDFANDLDYAGIVGTTIQNNGLPVDTFMTGDLDAQSNNIENANLVSATGQLTGDVTGSVFSDDSSVMVDAVNFAMFADLITLTPLNAPPDAAVAGMLAVADRVNWDPLGRAAGNAYPIFFDGSNWVSFGSA